MAGGSSQRPLEQVSPAGHQRGRGSSCLRDVGQAPVLQIALDLLLPAAIDYALTLQHPVYDCFYLAAAHLHDTHMVTADVRFARRVASQPDHAFRVRLRADLAP
jgi:predicted nucleic acid-binding protein